MQIVAKRRLIALNKYNIKIRIVLLGIGNSAGKNAVRQAQCDNMNILGNKGKNHEDHFHPYNDYTGYTPINLATRTNDPTRWQPALLRRGEDHYGAFVSQQFITPQLREVTPFTFKNDLNKIFLKPPGRSDKVPEPIYKKCSIYSLTFYLM